jgi:hypothetical protein
VQFPVPPSDPNRYGDHERQAFDSTSWNPLSWIHETDPFSEL